MVDTMATDVTMEISVEGSRLAGHATLRSNGRVLETHAEAVRHVDGSIDTWATDLVTARLLRGLEIALMERVHERIDRSVSNE